MFQSASELTLARKIGHSFTSLYSVQSSPIASLIYIRKYNLEGICRHNGRLIVGILAIRTDLLSLIHIIFKKLSSNMQNKMRLP
jgi:hypothetical protein